MYNLAYAIRYEHRTGSIYDKIVSDLKEEAPILLLVDEVMSVLPMRGEPKDQGDIIKVSIKVKVTF